MKKSATQSRKQTSDVDLADHTAVGAVDNSGTTGADSDQDLTQLVWKYFGEKISETLREMHCRRHWQLNKAAQAK